MTPSSVSPSFRLALFVVMFKRVLIWVVAGVETCGLQIEMEGRQPKLPPPPEEPFP
jgi:hypothetical protein